MLIGDHVFVDRDGIVELARICARTFGKVSFDVVTANGERISGLYPSPKRADLQSTVPLLCAPVPATFLADE